MISNWNPRSMNKDNILGHKESISFSQLDHVLSQLGDPLSVGDGGGALGRVITIVTACRLCYGDEDTPSG